jgi:hypothetical protein
MATDRVAAMASLLPYSARLSRVQQTGVARRTDLLPSPPVDGYLVSQVGFAP